MPLSPPVRPTFVLLIVALIAALVTLPGAGIETRSLSEFASSGLFAIFLGLGVAFLVLDVAALMASWRRPLLAAYLAIIAGIAAVLFIVPDLARVTGSPPPAGVEVVEIIELASVVFMLAFSTRLLLRRSPTDSTPPIGGGPLA